MLAMSEWGKGFQRVNVEVVISVILIVASLIILAYP
jgi:hypothetical protein